VRSAVSVADVIDNFRDMIQNVDSFSWIVDWPGGRSPTKDGRGGRLLVRNFQASGEPQPAKHPDERWYEAARCGTLAVDLSSVASQA
jgi:hypothetical protein